jgi:hypothetical protein
MNTMSYSDSDVVYKTETGGCVVTTMVPWRTNDNEGAACIRWLGWLFLHCLRTHNRVNSLANTADRSLYSIDRPRADCRQ